MRYAVSKRFNGGREINLLRQVHLNESETPEESHFPRETIADTKTEKRFSESIVKMGILCSRLRREESNGGA